MPAPDLRRLLLPGAPERARPGTSAPSNVSVDTVLGRVPEAPGGRTRVNRNASARHILWRSNYLEGNTDTSHRFEARRNRSGTARNSAVFRLGEAKRSAKRRNNAQVRHARSGRTNRAKGKAPFGSDAPQLASGDAILIAESAQRRRTGFVRSTSITVRVDPLRVYRRPTGRRCGHGQPAGRPEPALLRS
jgi:hypothetical protein